MVDERIQKCVEWQNPCCIDEEIEETISCLLSQELTVDSAIQIALLNNPNIQVSFEQIGIAHADLVEAGLLQNPIIDGFVRFPEHHGVVNTEFSILQNFLDVLLIPIRENIACASFEQAQLQVVNDVLNLAYEIQETFYWLLSEQEKLDLMFPIVEALQAANELTQEQNSAGNINPLEVQSRMNVYLESKAELTKMEIAIVRLREKMNRLLGLSLNDCWSISSRFPELPPCEVSLECLEEIALSERLELEIIRWEIEKVARKSNLTQWWARTAAAIGISSERDAEGITTTGPAFAFELPLFNYGQADREKINALFSQNVQRLRSKEIEIAAEVRSARDRLLLNRNLLATYQEQILPLQTNIVMESEKFYSAMALSVYSLLNAKVNEIRMRIHFNEAQRDYWISKAELIHALGGNYVH